MITSANNTQVKNIVQLNQKAKARREQSSKGLDFQGLCDRIPDSR